MAAEESKPAEQQHPAITRDEEEPMEQEEANPVTQEEAVDTVSQVKITFCDEL